MSAPVIKVCEYMATARRVNAKNEVVEYRYIKRNKYALKEKGIKNKRNVIRLSLSDLSDEVIDKMYALLPPAKTGGIPVRAAECTPPVSKIADYADYED